MEIEAAYLKVFTSFTDEPCRAYAIYASDGVGTKSGLTKDDTCVEHGGIRIAIDGGNYGLNYIDVKIIQKVFLPQVTLLLD